ncbi:MAG: aminomethyl-transferring glycine dehydrogenase subunit GcvPA [Lachnospiraceae bacterium]|nr:aminomethyl-transferring glycine dehydrogenase subunit GcvPA [Lachnospiraceae bacterium]
MGSYVSITEMEQQEMLDAIGVHSLDELYRDVPAQMILKEGELKLPSGKSELEVRESISAYAAQNTRFATVLRGAGSYRHYIPAAVKSVISREELVTAYTPYQAEVSQGILQSIYEYQSMICQLFGMDVSNASVYDGCTAAAEAVGMCRDRRRGKALVSACADPQVIETIRTYCFGSGMEVVLVPEKNGCTDADALKELVGADVACLYIQQPNYYGQMEDAEGLGAIIHEAGGKYIMGVNPIACAVMATLGECGADIAVGEGQPLGLPTGFGGPYLGIMTATQAMMRKLPGRIVGKTSDHDGNVGYVLTLTAREQHIRREKASSNICSNEALCALTAAVYLSAMGAKGLTEAAEQSMAKAHYLAGLLAEAGLPLKYEGEYFHEFVTVCEPQKAQAILDALEKKGILGGLPVEGGLLWCATEMVSRAKLDETAAIVKEVLAR